jgi:hypothetical protein
MRHIAHLAERKQRLVARCAAQRAAIAGGIQALERPIAIADRITDAARFLRAHSMLVSVAVIAAVAAVAFRRGTVLGLAARSLAAWRAWRSLNVWARRLGLEFPGSGRREKSGHVAS